MRKSSKVPTDRCDECAKVRPAFGFVTLTSEQPGAARHICSECYNRWYMRRAGLPELETAYFDPITRRDSVGKKHTFHFVVHMSTGLGIKAFEYVDDEQGGYQFSVLEPPQTPVREAHARLVEKIEAGIGVRYLESSDFPGAAPSQNRLYVKGSAVNGRIHERDGTPRVVIDGREYSWEEFGEFLSCFTGFDFRLECFNASESREISSDPVRPDPLWWLEDAEPVDPEDRRHH